MAHHTDDEHSILTNSGRDGPRSASRRSRFPALSLASGLASASVLGLVALPATAAGIDPAKIAADPLAQRELEIIDGHHHLHSVGPLAAYVIAADSKRGQVCSLTDTGHGLYTLDCGGNGSAKAHSFILNDENGRYLVITMYDEQNRPLDAATAYARVTALTPPESDLVSGLGDPAPPSASMEPAPAPVKAAADSDAFLPGLPNSVDLAKGTTEATRFWATGQDNHRHDLGSARDLDVAVTRRGGRCVIAGEPASPSQIVCRYPHPGNPSPDAADELAVEASFSYHDCLEGGRNCYEIRDISLNDKRLTHAQYLQLVSEPAIASTAESASNDSCLWSFVHNQKVDMGSLRALDGFIHQIGGACYINELKGGSAHITCRFPDSRTHRTHELLLEGDADGASCYGITHTALDGKTLPYEQYTKVFIDHK